jgi:hypothetical protein
LWWRRRLHDLRHGIAMEVYRQHHDVGFFHAPTRKAITKIDP